MKRYISLFENFNDNIDYIVKPVGEYFRIFAKTPKMEADGSDYKDCETLFGKGTMWTDYDSQGSAERAIDSMSNTGNQLYRSGKVHGLTNHDSVGMSKPSYGKPHGPSDYMAN